METGLVSGWHYGVAAEDYHADPAVSRSALSVLAQATPAHMHAHMTRVEKKSKDHYLFGEAAHTLMLEPVRFGTAYRVCTQEECEIVTAAGKKCSNRATHLTLGGSNLCGVHARHRDDVCGDKPTLSTSDMGTLVAMSTAMHRHEEARKIMAHLSLVEPTGVATCPDTGVTFRFRPDGIGTMPDGRRVLVDYKTTRKRLANEHAMRSVIGEFAYHHQAGLYLYGSEILPHPHDACGDDIPIDVDTFIFVLQEKSSPYAVRVVQLGAHTVNAGREQMRDALAAYAQTDMSTPVAYPSRVEVIDLYDYHTHTDFTEEDES